IIAIVVIRGHIRCRLCELAVRLVQARRHRAIVRGQIEDCPCQGIMFAPVVDSLPYPCNEISVEHEDLSLYATSQIAVGNAACNRALDQIDDYAILDLADRTR